MRPEQRGAVEPFLRSLNAAWKSLGLYPPTHPAAQAYFQKLSEALDRLMAGSDRLTLGLFQDTLVLDGTPLMERAELSQKLVERLRDGKIQGVTFLKGYTSAELRSLVELLGQDATSTDVGQELRHRGVLHILLVKTGVDEERESQQEVVDLVRAGVIYNRALQTTRRIFQEARLGKVPSLTEVHRVVESLVAGILKRKNSLLALTMIKSYDEYLFNHSVNVGILTMALGETLKLDLASLRELGLGALLHDIGKIRIPESVTRKLLDLTEEEWHLIKTHPEEGVRILQQMGVRSEIVLRVVKEHHVRFDRKGYPTLGEKEDVHPYSMLVTISDSYDAMTTVRPYRPAFEPSQAIAKMKSLSGSVFDPQMLHRFVEMLGIHPPGAAVRLTTGEIGVVTRPGTEDTARPWVRIIQDREGNRVDGGEVSLLEWDPEAGDYLRSILVAVNPTFRGIDVADILQQAAISEEG